MISATCFGSAKSTLHLGAVAACGAARETPVPAAAPAPVASSTETDGRRLTVADTAAAAGTKRGVRRRGCGVCATVTGTAVAGVVGGGSTGRVVFGATVREAVDIGRRATAAVSIWRPSTVCGGRVGDGPGAGGAD